jgi:FkbM family methyltransferase
MLMSLPELVVAYNLDIQGVLHVGAHLGEEAEIYESLGVKDVWWVEANEKVLPVLANHVVDRYGHTLIHGLVYSYDGAEMDFNVTNYDGMSSSILEFGTHPQFSPDTVFVDKVKMTTTTIDAIAEDFDVEANFLNMDLQGAELHALKGARKFLKGVQYIMTEVNNEEVYVNCAKVNELDDLLRDFVRVETYWVPGQGWGDALYIRTGD